MTKKIKTYEDGVADEQKRILEFLVDSGIQLETYSKYGKRRYKKIALHQLRAVEAVIDFIDPKFFDANQDS
jgi:hypothetical protein